MTQNCKRCEGAIASLYLESQMVIQYDVSDTHETRELRVKKRVSIVAFAVGR